jgi:hypothetical protein
MNIKKFDSFVVNENAPILMTEPNPYTGYYDSSNGDVDKLIQFLDEEGIEYDYNKDTNVVDILSNEYIKISNVLKECGIPHVRKNGTWQTIDYKNPLNCVILFPENEVRLNREKGK